MKALVRVIAALALAALLQTSSQALATTYFYTGNVGNKSFNNVGNFVSATVDLNCAGICSAGTYLLGSGINSFSLSDNTSANAPVFTHSSSDANADLAGFTDYLVLDSSGTVTKWLLLNYETVSSTSQWIFTMGNDAAHGTQDFAGIFNTNTHNYEYYDQSLADAGTWRVVDPAGGNIAPAVPEPSTWAMMILGFFGIGFMAYRRKQSGSLAAAGFQIRHIRKPSRRIYNRRDCPETSTWAMLLIGFAGIGFAAYRRNRMSVAVVQLRKRCVAL